MVRELGRCVEVVFCFLAASAYTGAYIAVTQSADHKMGESNPVNAAVMAFVLLGILALGAIRWRRMLFVARHGGAVNLFVVFVAVSTLWSDSPASTLKRCAVLLQGVLFAYLLLAAFPVERIIRLWASVITVAMAASAVVALAAPGVGVMSSADLAGTWRGVFAHKSQLGAMAAFGLLCVGWSWVHEPKRRLFHGVCLLLCAGLALMSKSKTAQIATVLSLAVSVFLVLLRRPGLGRVWVIYLAAVACSGAGVLFVTSFGDIMAALGKDVSFTGRVPAWTILLELAGDRVWSGYGYSAFFVEGNLDSDYVSGRAAWDVVQAHNGYVELLLDLGLLGLLFGIWTIAEALWRSLRLWFNGARPWASFAVTYVIGLSVINLVETVLYRAGEVHCIVLSLVYVALRVQAAAATARGPTWALSRPDIPLEVLHGVRGVERSGSGHRRGPF